MKTKVLIVSMTNAIERRENMQAMLANASFDWDFFDAHTTKHEDLQIPAQTNLLPGEIGCYSSHYACWKFLSNSNYDQLLILEDDVLIDVPFIERILNANLNDVNIGFIKLFAKLPFNYKYISTLFTFFHIVRYTTKTWGTQSYIIHKNATHSLLKNVLILDEPVDVKLDNHFISTGGSFILFPFPVIEKSVESQIGMGRFKKKNLTVKLQILSTIKKILNQLGSFIIKFSPLTKRYRLIRKLILEKKLN